MARHALALSLLLGGGVAVARGDVVADAPASRDSATTFLCPFDGNDVAKVIQNASAATATVKGVASLLPGKFGQALHLATDSELNVESTNTLIQGDHFRISFWMSSDLHSTPDGMPIQMIANLNDKGDASGAAVQFKVIATQPAGASKQMWQLSYQVTGTDSGRKKAEHIPVSLDDWKPGEWHHVGLTYAALDRGGKLKGPTSGIMRVFIDGNCVAMDVRAPVLTGAGTKLSLQSKAHDSSCLIDDLKIDQSTKPFTASTIRWEGFLPGNGDLHSRTNLPLYLYFSQPMDSRFGEIVLFDETAQQPHPSQHGKFIGDQSVFKIDFETPLPFGHRFTLRFPGSSENGCRSIDGVVFDPKSISEQSFNTRKQGEPPTTLSILFRNDNLHTSLAGTEQMMRAGIDIVEFNPVKLKDAWVSNHGKPRANLPPNLFVGEGGDQAGFDAITTSFEDTPYSAYANLDFVDTKDGKIDVIPRLEDQIRIVNNWDKLIEIQGLSEVSADEYNALYTAGGLRWERVLAYHGPVACCYEKPFERWEQSAAYPQVKNWLVGRATYMQGMMEEKDPLFPDGITPAFIERGKKQGKMLWMYAFSNRNPGTLLMAARLGIDVYVPDNDMAFLGNTTNRKTLYKYNDYEGAQPPTIGSIRSADHELDAQAAVPTSPEIRIDFSVPMEARSVNYDSVRLVVSDDASGTRLAMSIRTDESKPGFILKPLQPLKKNTKYTLAVGSDIEPLSANGMKIANPRTITFTTANTD